MQNKTDKTVSMATPSTVAKSKWNGAFGYSPAELHMMGWKGLNFTAVTAATAASIAVVQNPLKALAVTLSRTGTYIPHYSGGYLGLGRALFAGTRASMSGSGARTVYVTSAKNNKPGEPMTEGTVREEGVVKEERTITKRTSRENMVYVATVTSGDICVSQIPESLAGLYKIPGLLPQNFKWYTPSNAFQLMSGGIVPRFASGMVNFTSLCLLEEHIANALPIQNRQSRHFAAGALSGGVAAIVAYPFSAFKDNTLGRAKVTPDGHLVNESSFKVAREMTQAVISNPRQTAKTFFANAAKQLPVRIGLATSVFSIVAGLGETLGSEPLKDVVPKEYQPSSASSSQRFFGSSSAVSVPVEATKKDVSPTEPPAPK